MQQPVRITSNSQIPSKEQINYLNYRGIVSAEPLREVQPDVNDFTGETMIPVQNTITSSEIKKEDYSAINNMVYTEQDYANKVSSNVFQNSQQPKDYSSNMELEKNYYIEKEKGLFLAKRIEEVESNNKRTVETKENLKRHYEDIIERMSRENQELKKLERSYFELDEEKKRLEREIAKYKVEVEMLKDNQRSDESELVQNLRLKIRNLNEEKQELTRTLQVQQNEIITLRGQINSYSLQSQRERDNFQRQINDLRTKIQKKSVTTSRVTQPSSMYVNTRYVEPVRVERVVRAPVRRETVTVEKRMPSYTTNHVYTPCSCRTNRLESSTQNQVTYTRPVTRTYVKRSTSNRQSGVELDQRRSSQYSIRDTFGNEDVFDTTQNQGSLPRETIGFNDVKNSFNQESIVINNTIDQEKEKQYSHLRVNEKSDLNKIYDQRRRAILKPEGEEIIEKKEE